MPPFDTRSWAKPWSAPRKTRSRGRLFLLLALLLPMAGCALCQMRRGAPPPPVDLSGRTPRTIRMEVTAYCACGECCGWNRNWYGRPVIASGPNRGQPKAVGITASGTRAGPGTIAADTTLLPFGAILYVPGYGYGVVEDRGSAIQGRRLDVFFHSHRRALDWGRQQLDVTVWQ